MEIKVYKVLFAKMIVTSVISIRRDVPEQDPIQVCSDREKVSTPA